MATWDWIGTVKHPDKRHFFPTGEWEMLNLSAFYSSQFTFIKSTKLIIKWTKFFSNLLKQRETNNSLKSLSKVII